jgi:dihydroorotase
MMFDLGIEDATVLTANGRQRFNVYVQDGRFGAFSDTALPAKQVVNGRGLLMFPGIVDSHVHSRDPGLTHKEDFLHSTKAAAAGGVTTVLEMPNSVPPVIDRTQFLARRADLQAKATVDFGLWGMVTSESTDQDIRELVDCGVCAFKLFWGYALDRNTRALVYVPEEGQAVIAPPDNGRVLELFALLASAGKVLAIHAEDNAIIALRTQRGYVGDDPVDRLLWERPVVAEAATIALATEFSRVTGCSVHIVHMSSAVGVDIVQQAHSQGMDITAETCPQYVALTAEDVKELGPVAKVYPPIRHETDRRALIAGLRAGTVSFVASDHAPHSSVEKRLPFSEAPAGFAGVQTLFPVLLDMALRGELSLDLLPRILSTHPARRYGLLGKKGDVQVGYDADFVLVDANSTTTWTREHLYSLSPENPWMDRTLKGALRATYLRGQLVAEDGHIVAQGKGQFVSPGPR